MYGQDWAIVSVSVVVDLLILQANATREKTMGGAVHEASLSVHARVYICYS